MRKFVLISVVLCAVALLASCGGSSTPTGSTSTTGMVVMQFQDGVYPSNAYAGAEDSTLFSADPYANSGTAAGESIGNSGGGKEKCRMLVKFDISNIVPADSHVVSAYLNLQTVAGRNNTITAYAVTKPWSENGCSWVSRTATELWDTPGGDRGNTMGAKAATSAECEIFLNRDIVNSWISSPSTNYGMELVASDETTGSTEYISAYMSENGAINLRPSLTVYYIP